MMWYHANTPTDFQQPRVSAQYTSRSFCLLAIQVIYVRGPFAPLEVGERRLD